MLKKGDRFEYRGVEYTVLDIVIAGGLWYKVKGECGAIKMFPEELESWYSFRKLK